LEAKEYKNSNFTDFIHSFENTLKSAFHVSSNINEFSLERGIPPHVLQEIMNEVPLSVAIPKQYGGRGAIVKECLGLLAAASYESLPLSLTFGINIALFLEPVAKYGNENVKEGIFKKFLEQQQMGGLMITEPDYGSDALNMQTYNTKLDGNYFIKGTKHWQGLTSMADFWLITSRSKNDKGVLGRDIDFFICEESKDGQKVIVEELFDNLVAALKLCLADPELVSFMGANARSYVEQKLPRQKVITNYCKFLDGDWESIDADMSV
jgi:alkylation response protein AidB-like acyl-CoA dehydrogenase